MKLSDLADHVARVEVHDLDGGSVR
jgi:hypothetical protein